MADNGPSKDVNGEEKNVAEFVPVVGGGRPGIGPQT